MLLQKKVQIQMKKQSLQDSLNKKLLDVLIPKNNILNAILNYNLII